MPDIRLIDAAGNVLAVFAEERRREAFCVARADLRVVRAEKTLPTGRIIDLTRDIVPARRTPAEQEAQQESLKRSVAAFLSRPVRHRFGPLVRRNRRPRGAQ
jgi:hypothetical protein